MTRFHEFTAYAAPPGKLPGIVERYAETVLPGLASRGRSLAGAWIAEFGALSRMLTLCEVDPGAALAMPGDEALGLAAAERRLCRLARPLATSMPCGVVEYRIYTVAPGQREAYLERMLANLHLRERHSPNIGVWAPLDGKLDQVVHLWGYADIQQRMQAREAAFADPDWRAYLVTVYPLLVEMASTILVPTTFSALR